MDIRELLKRKSKTEGISREFLDDIKKTLEGESSLNIEELIQWGTKWISIELDGYTINEETRCMLTIQNYTTYQREIIRLGEQNGRLLKEKLSLTSSDGWIRKNVLYLLFGSVLIFILIALVAEAYGLQSTQNVYALVSSLTTVLGTAIGYYFKVDSQPLVEDKEVLGLVYPEGVTVEPQENTPTQVNVSEGIDNLPESITGDFK
jgi:hypothetical protein